MGGLGFQRFF